MVKELETVVETSIRYNGRKYSRKPNGYYYNCSTRKHLHQAIWIDNNGPIPEGYEIHHIDFNKENNDISNLACITKEEHHKIHGNALTDEQREWRRQNLAKNARPKANEWHKSEEGRAWHSEHGKRMVAEGKCAFTKQEELVCDFCGKSYVGKRYSATSHTFCSNKCKAAFRRASGVDDIEVQCAACGNKFKMSKYDFKRYNKNGDVTCSRRCYNQYMNNQKSLF